MSDAVDLNGSVGEVIREAASLLDVAWARIDAELLGDRIGERHGDQHDRRAVEHGSHGRQQHGEGKQKADRADTGGNRPVGDGCR